MPANQSPALPYFSQPLPHPLRKCSFFNAAGVNVDGGDVFVMGWCNRCVARMATRRAGVISALFLIAVSSAPPVYSQVAAKVDPNRKAYDFTIRCFVAGAVANSDKRFNLNGANKAALVRAASARSMPPISWAASSAFPSNISRAILMPIAAFTSGRFSRMMPVSCGRAQLASS